jgi:hypothetical protein
MIDVDARYRLDRQTLRILDASYELVQGAVNVPMSRARLVEHSGESEDDVDAALRVLTEEVRRIHGLEFERSEAPTTFALVYVPRGNAYGAYWALYEPRDADIGGCASRRGMEAWQGRWRDLEYVDFDDGLAELEQQGWAEQCERDDERWRLTARGGQLGRTRLKLR